MLPPERRGRYNMVENKSEARQVLGQFILQMYIKKAINENKNDFEKFVLQQNYIQFLLIQVIAHRSVTRDRKFLDSLEDNTLGKLIDFFKVCSGSNEDEKSLILSLISYNRLRNELVHKILSRNSSFNVQEAFEKVKSINKIGDNVTKGLDKIINLHKATILRKLRNSK